MRDVSLFPLMHVSHDSHAVFFQQPASCESNTHFPSSSYEEVSCLMKHGIRDPIFGSIRCDSCLSFCDVFASDDDQDDAEDGDRDDEEERESDRKKAVICWLQVLRSDEVRGSLDNNDVGRK